MGSTRAVVCSWTAAVLAFGLVTAVSPPAPSSAASMPKPATSAPVAAGYVLAAADGGTFAFGDVPYEGSMAGQHLDAPVTAVAEDVDTGGYWLGGRDRGIFAFGDASFRGSRGSGSGFVYSSCVAPPGVACPQVVESTPVFPESVLNSPVTGIAGTLDDGYLTVQANGFVLDYSAAPDRGDALSLQPASPIVGIAMSKGDAGYWLVGADGGVFAFGDAPFWGSLAGKPLSAPITGVVASPDRGGYWLVGADGGVFAFGDAPFFGSLPSVGVVPAGRVVGMAPTPDGAGYWLASSDGGVYSFGDAPFLGGVAGSHLAAPVTGIAATTGNFVPLCGGNVSLTAGTDAQQYLPGQPVTLSLTFANTSGRECLGDTGAAGAGCHDLQVYQADSNGAAQQLVWDEGASQSYPSCAPTDYMQPMAAGSSVTKQISWSQDSCPPTGDPNSPCPGPRVPSGHYLVWGAWGTYTRIGGGPGYFDIIGP